MGAWRRDSVGEEIEDVADRRAVGLEDLGVAAALAGDGGEALALHVAGVPEIAHSLA